MADHVFRYFRLAISAINSGSIWQMSVLNFLDDSGQRFVYPSGTTYTVSRGSYGSGENPSKILDNSTSTKLCIGFSVEATPQYITYDMLTPVLDLSIYTKWCWYTANDTSSYSGRNIKTYNLEVSNDGENWTIIDSQENGSYTSSNYTLAYTGYCGTYLINAFANPEGSGTFINDGYHIHDTRVALTAQPSLGYKFINWQLNDYTQLEYIESSGTQYIDSGVSLGSNNFEVDATIVEYQSSSSESAIFSIWTSSYNYWNFFIRSDQGLDCYVNDHYIKGNIVVGNKYDVQVKRNGNSWQYGVIDNLGSISFSRGDNNTTLKFLTRGDANNSSSHIRLYGAKVLVSENIVRDFIPVFKHSTGEIGLLDLVNLKFYGNSGTGTFKAGRKVIGYKTLEYLDGTGEQRIDTGFIPNNNTRFIIDINAPDPTANTPSWAYGVRVAINNRSFGYLVRTGNDTSRADWGNSVVDFTKTLGRMEIDQNINKTYINGTLIATNTSTTFTCPYSLKILGCNLNGSIETYASPITLYSAKLYDNGILIRDYIPAQEIYEDGSLGRASLYDKITKTMFISEGTKDFLPGPITGEIDLDGGEL